MKIFLHCLKLRGFFFLFFIILLNLLLFFRDLLLGKEICVDSDSSTTQASVMFLYKKNNIDIYIYFIEIIYLFTSQLDGRSWSGHV